MSLILPYLSLQALGLRLTYEEICRLFRQLKTLGMLNVLYRDNIQEEQEESPTKQKKPIQQKISKRQVILDASAP